jgi:excisionase family DNA binding protein
LLPPTRFLLVTDYRALQSYDLLRLSINDFAVMSPRFGRAKGNVMSGLQPPPQHLAAALSSTAAYGAPPQHAPMAFTIPEACKISKVGRSKLYIAIQTGALRARKLGKKTLILPDDLRAWLESLPAFAVAAG